MVPEVPCFRRVVGALSPQMPSSGDLTVMARLNALKHAFLRPALTVAAAAVIALPALSIPALARGPEAIADVAEKVIDAVVNISTSQKIEGRSGGGAQRPPSLPPGSPFEEFFEACRQVVDAGGAAFREGAVEGREGDAQLGLDFTAEPDRDGLAGLLLAVEDEIPEALAARVALSPEGGGSLGERELLVDSDAV